MILTDIEIVKIVQPYTLLSIERIINLLSSVEYIIKNDIPGDLIEIGVWKGGAIMAIALKCIQLNASRKIHVYDTFEGMTETKDVDVDLYGRKAEDIFESVKCYSCFDETKANIDKCEYKNIEYHIGDIRETNILEIPKDIALLRLDTDWYELTKFELLHFAPNVVSKGIIIIDDYGHWKGCKKAVDEYLIDKNIEINQIDYTGIWWQVE